MPHIIIREEDNTKVDIAEEYNIVYIPGLRGKDGTLDYGKPTLYNNVDKFVKDITGSVDGNVNKATDGSQDTKDNPSGVIAKQLLKLGLVVLYEAFDEHASLPGAVKWNKLTDKGLYRIKFLTTGGYPNIGIIGNMLSCAESRGDCIALIDHEEEYTSEQLGNKTFAKYVFDLFNTETMKGYKNLRFGAAFSPWCKFNLDEGEFTLPGSFAYLSAYAYAVGKNPNWYAAAGSKRGIIPNIEYPTQIYGDADCLVLQARNIKSNGDFADDDNTGIAINPIADIRPFGKIVWGNRTLLDNNSGLTASSFLNVRNLCCDIKKNLYTTARKLTFEQNNDILWTNFTAEITPLLEKALSGNGIRGYRLVREPINKKGCLKARIRIVPIEAVEDFDLTLELTDSIENVTENI